MKFLIEVSEVLSRSVNVSGRSKVEMLTEVDSRKLKAWSDLMMHRLPESR